MQRLTTAAPINDATLKIYAKTIAIIHRHLSPSLALFYAMPRRNVSGHLEWWTERQGLAKPLAMLAEAEQLTVQAKRQQYQEILGSLVTELSARGEEDSASILQSLLSNSHECSCYSVGGEPVLINWGVTAQDISIEQVVPLPIVTIPRRRRSRPWILLLLLLLLVSIGSWYKYRSVLNSPVSHLRNTELTQANPSVNLGKRKDFGRIKVNLAWQQGKNKLPIDLDIAAFIRLKNGDTSAAEALSKLRGSFDTPPYLLLQKDLRDGSEQDGEWLFINGSHWEEIDEVMIYSFIYDGTNNWRGTDATITVYVPHQPAIKSTLTDGNQHNNVAAIARLKNVDGNITVERLDGFFPNRETLDQHYGWGFKWKPGASKN